PLTADLSLLDALPISEGGASAPPVPVFMADLAGRQVPCGSGAGPMPPLSFAFRPLVGTEERGGVGAAVPLLLSSRWIGSPRRSRSEEHTSELQSRENL